MKYKNKPTGKFRSKLEERIWKSRPRKRGVSYKYEADRLNYYLPKTYIPDFTTCLPNGHIIYIEVKGYFRPEDKTKMRAVKQANPDEDIRLVFPTHDESNEKWAKKYGFPYAIGAIPKEWLQ